ncbi:hypothetical protein NDU88_003692 [Pleurodeles waltl]|uniref:Uncharacterized protein n=1 Tax=Pleurodeles waltl TaxID=8319 RepID=A0AAV7MRB7_PLEWA|nr:hypothetical protein NDU88_003692 [Pleurodeles waltl]
MPLARLHQRFLAGSPPPGPPPCLLLFITYRSLKACRVPRPQMGGLHRCPPDAPPLGPADIRSGSRRVRWGLLPPAGPTGFSANVGPLSLPLLCSLCAVGGPSLPPLYAAGHSPLAAAGRPLSLPGCCHLKELLDLRLPGSVSAPIVLSPSPSLLTHPRLRSQGLAEDCLGGQVTKASAAERRRGSGICHTGPSWLLPIGYLDKEFLEKPPPSDGLKKPHWEVSFSQEELEEVFKKDVRVPPVERNDHHGSPEKVSDSLRLARKKCPVLLKSEGPQSQQT